MFRVRVRFRLGREGLEYVVNLKVIFSVFCQFLVIVCWGDVW